MVEHIVPGSVQPVGLARYLSRAWPHVPGHVFRDALKNKDVRVNGVRSGAQASVKAGDHLQIYADARFFEAPIDVVHDDGRILCVNKPVGLPVDADAMGIGADTLIARVQAKYPTARLCHRLDADTGGLVLLALTDEAYGELTDAFKRQLVDKRYHAVVLGRPQPSEAVLQAHLIKDAGTAKVRVIDRERPGSRPIVTGYRVLKSNGELSLIEVRLFTGRTHQIRAHMAHMNHPLAGDDKYGERAANKNLGVKSPQLWCVSMRYGELELFSQPRLINL